MSTVDSDTGAPHAVEVPGATTANRRAGAKTAVDLVFVRMDACDGGVPSVMDKSNNQHVLCLADSLISKKYYTVLCHTLPQCRALAGRTIVFWVMIYVCCCYIAPCCINTWFKFGNVSNRINFPGIFIV